MYSTSRLALAGAMLLSLVACNSKSPPPPPPPVAASPAAPQSACPDTPPGTKVGPMGCPCDMTVQLQFKSDSAELTPEDQARLDQVAESLKRLHWISGTVEGYTDATQQAEANQKLSEQRATTVRDYLLSKGVGDDRMKVVGYGETNPIADNSTPEGRALNRRVVLRRMDCDEQKP
jgi:outer membrane protein OmpA-like peptidoglycan-associated protein